MPLPIIAEALFHGLSAIPYYRTILRIAPWLLLVALLKWYFGGARNTSERVMYSKVVMITGGTSGIGASIARSLAQRGAQIVLLTHHPPSDPFLVDYVDDLRLQTSNELIYAEQVDLSSLHSIRVFATKWIDNAPPRRLDMIILCANALQRSGRSVDGVEATWGINYLANFHLLSILSPAIRAQPPDRDVRVLMGTCSSYIGAKVIVTDEDLQQQIPSGRGYYGASKMALMIFAQSFQKHLDAYVRPDKHLNTARVIMVDPGWTRTPGMRHWLSGSSLWGLLIYLVSWPFWWLVLKSPEQGAQTFLYAAMEAKLAGEAGGKMVKECREVDCARKEVMDEKLGKELWEASEKQIEALEKEGAVKRAQAKKDREAEEADGGVIGETQKTAPTQAEKKPGSRRSRKAG